jgi:ABC-type glycerol-3-phosphate transport system permease component
MTARVRLGSWATYIFLAGYTLFVIGPFVWIVACSLKDRR